MECNRSLVQGTIAGCGSYCFSHIVLCCPLSKENNIDEEKEVELAKNGMKEIEKLTSGL